MTKVLRVLVFLPAVLFLVMGLRWAIDPAGVAGQFGMPLLDGVGRSSQIGDVGGYFLALSIMMLLGVTTAQPKWLYPAVLMLTMTAILRTVAWLLHGAPLALDMIAPEVIVSVLLLLLAFRLERDSTS